MLLIETLDAFVNYSLKIVDIADSKVVRSGKQMGFEVRAYFLDSFLNFWTSSE